MSRHIVYRDNKQELLVAYEEGKDALSFGIHRPYGLRNERYFRSESFEQSMESIWSLVQAYGSVASQVKASVTDILRGEVYEEEKRDDRTFSWNKGIPFEEIDYRG